MQLKFFVSAYVTSPSSESWQPVLESAYFRGLANLPGVIGIEHPFLIDSERYALPWLGDQLPEHFSVIITTLPLFMQAAKTDSRLGLASQDEAARTSAIKIMEKLKSYVNSLNCHFGRKVVKAIHFHSFPRNDESCIRGSEKALKKSLLEIKTLDFQGAELNLEHCDAYIYNRLSEKGFLLLEKEIEALGEIGGYGLALNWARSAIEGRSTQMPLMHIRAAQSAHLLRGFFFSGCTDKGSSLYGSWKDTHMPPQNIIQGQYLDNDSLLGRAEIKEVLSLLLNTPAVYLGVKITDRLKDHHIERKIGLNQETVKAIQSITLQPNER